MREKIIIEKKKKNCKKVLKKKIKTNAANFFFFYMVCRLRWQLSRCCVNTNLWRNSRLQM